MRAEGASAPLPEHSRLWHGRVFRVHARRNSVLTGKFKIYRLSCTIPRDEENTERRCCSPPSMKTLFKEMKVNYCASPFLRPPFPGCRGSGFKRIFCLVLIRGSRRGPPAPRDSSQTISHTAIRIERSPAPSHVAIGDWNFRF